MLAAGALFFMISASHAETRSLKLYFIHTKEKAEIVYKRNGRVDPAGMRQINRFLRDWRQNENANMDPRVLDIIWNVYREVGARDYIHIVSAYRSPKTNAMLRSRSSGVAKKSQHMLGHAIDFFIPGVPLKKLRDAGLKYGGGGVGYYPRSGSPFVHMDIGNVRHWPRMSRSELVAVFPKGGTLHVPSDGKPLPGYDVAMANYKKYQNSGTMMASASSSSGRGRGLLASLFGSGGEEEEDMAETAVAAAAPSRARSAPAPSAPVPAEEVATTVPNVAPTPLARPQMPGVPAATPAPVAVPPADIPGNQPAPVAEQPALVASLPAAGPMPLAAPRAALAAVNDEQQEAGGGMLAFAGDNARIPLPSPRPELARPSPEGGTARDEISQLLAMAQTEVDDAPVPAQRPAPALTVQAPRSDEKAEKGDSVVLAALSRDVVGASPAPKNEPLQPAKMLAGVPSREAPPTLPESTPQQVAALREEPRLIAKPASARPAIRSTAKGARPVAGESRHAAKPIVVPADGSDARWVLEGKHDEMVSQPPADARRAREIVRTAPKQVYTAGFQAPKDIDTARFSGKAVNFMSVARFQ
ncbi:hypothetical protein GCM10010136_06220 [Limoniibacter endophyticus]|uniref:Murein endopeptidase K n=2 Tax=Limoniibacter endophyticus TaxID=1565040 RepID=A0A8J3DMN2_9HYPH|nr:hypothetical protein GCM10010136_06220 [Limoniibacter endophyticus]